MTDADLSGDGIFSFALVFSGLASSLNHWFMGITLDYTTSHA
jgi:hypothetical protein